MMRHQSVWKIASPDGETLSKDKATPFVVNYEMVDTDKDGKISQAEFQAACPKGWIQQPDAATELFQHADQLTEFARLRHHNSPPAQLFRQDTARDVVRPKKGATPSNPASSC